MWLSVFGMMLCVLNRQETYGDFMSGLGEDSTKLTYEFSIVSSILSLVSFLYFLYHSWRLRALRGSELSYRCLMQLQVLGLCLYPIVHDIVNSEEGKDHFGLLTGAYVSISIIAFIVSCVRLISAFGLCDGTWFRSSGLQVRNVSAMQREIRRVALRHRWVDICNIFLANVLVASSGQSDHVIIVAMIFWLSLCGLSVIVHYVASKQLLYCLRDWYHFVRVMDPWFAALPYPLANSQPGPAELRNHLWPHLNTPFLESSTVPADLSTFHTPLFNPKAVKQDKKGSSISKGGDSASSSSGTKRPPGQEQEKQKKAEAVSTAQPQAGVPIHQTLEFRLRILERDAMKP
jgi:hypothetical protein